MDVYPVRADRELRGCIDEKQNEAAEKIDHEGFRVGDGVPRLRRLE